MPKIKDFEKAHKGNKVVEGDVLAKAVSANKRRRPGRDPADTAKHQPDVKVVIVDTGEQLEMEPQPVHSNHQNQEQAEAGAEPSTETMGADSSGPKVEINFPGSELLRARFSKSFQIAESIATDWMNDGKFEDLPLGHPLAQYFAAKGLQKAKQVEKQVLESPLTEKVAMQVLQAGMKAQEVIAQVRTKLKK